MFPNTLHVECVVLMSRNESWKTRFYGGFRLYS